MPGDWSGERYLFDITRSTLAAESAQDLQVVQSVVHGPRLKRGLCTNTNKEILGEIFCLFYGDEGSVYKVNKHAGFTTRPKVKQRH